MSLARTRATQTPACAPIYFRKALLTRNISSIGDLSFPAQHENAAAAQGRDYQVLTAALDEFLSKASSNFALEITSTEYLIQKLALANEEASTVTEEYNAHYNFALMLARGASFSK